MRTAILEIFDRNGFIHLFIISIVVTNCMIYSIWYAFLYPAILLVLELLHYVGGLSIFNPEKRIQRGYVVSAFLMTRYLVKGLITALIFIMAITRNHEIRHKGTSSNMQANS
jgi:hypothetical protein